MYLIRRMVQTSGFTSSTFCLSRRSANYSPRAKAILPVFVNKFYGNTATPTRELFMAASDNDRVQLSPTKPKIFNI